jgi:ribosome-associated toxin RatA of RatAB toxin-antitoxin module
MREVTRTALVTFSPTQMFALVEDFERYPEFLPWVSGARLVSRQANQLLGELQMQRMGVTEKFTTRNTLYAPARMDMELVEGPFKTLTGTWLLTALNDAEGALRGCKVELNIRFEFKNAMLEMLFGKAFETSCGSLVDAFIQRAKALYSEAGR